MKKVSFYYQGKASYWDLKIAFEKFVKINGIPIRIFMDKPVYDAYKNMYSQTNVAPMTFKKVKIYEKT